MNHSFEPPDNYAIVDAKRWLIIRNGFDRVVRVIPPEKHEFNAGEYYYTELGEIIPKTGFNNTENNQLSYLTSDIDKYLMKLNYFSIMIQRI